MVTGSTGATGSLNNNPAIELQIDSSSNEAAITEPIVDIDSLKREGFQQISFRIRQRLIKDCKEALKFAWANQLALTICAILAVGLLKLISPFMTLNVSTGMHRLIPSVYKGLSLLFFFAICTRLVMDIQLLIISSLFASYKRDSFFLPLLLTGKCRNREELFRCLALASLKIVILFSSAFLLYTVLQTSRT